jgi:hypothetical protein
MGSKHTQRLMGSALLLVGCQRIPTYHQDIQPILAGRCVQCHQDGEVAPYSFETYDDVLQTSGLIADAVSLERMPPWFAVGDHQAYRNDPSLHPDEMAMVVDWANNGAPEGDANKPQEPYSNFNQTLSAIDLVLKMPEPFQPTVQPDEYRCFVLDWEPDGIRYVTGFDAVPGNIGIVHHMAAYLFRPDSPYGLTLFDILEQWDQASPGPGYPCFGGPSGGDDVDVPIQQLAQWVPGMGATVFPAGSGIEVPVGSKVVLQIHYNNTETTNPIDQSSVVFSLEESVTKQGAFAPWLDTTWPLGTMTIPAGNPAVVLGKQGSPIPLFEFLAPTMDLSNGFDIHSALVHMHQLGEAATVGVARSDGTQELLLEIKNYSFDWQLVYHLENPIVFHPEDELSITCTWDNSAENQPDGQPPRDVNWGESSRDEMCVANLFITER